MFSTPRRRRIGWALVYACVAMIFFGFVYTITAIRTTQLEGTPTGEKLLASADRILDCTDAEGECAQRNQARTAEAVADLTGNLTRVIVLASACSADLPERLSVQEREVSIQRCVIERLATEPAPE